MKLTDSTFRVFERLVRRTFLVLDLEFCIDDEGEHIVSVGIVPVVRGRRETAFYRVIHPGVPIDAATAEVHGFTDADVKGKRRFGFHARKILDQLDIQDAVLVTHTPVDVRVLRLELERLGADASTTLADLPELPLLDTSSLGRLVGFPGIGSRGIVGLQALCELTGTSRTDAHNAKADATATADALLELLVHAANTDEYDDIDVLLAAHDRGTTHAPRAGGYLGPRDNGITLPPAHLALHTSPLTHKGTKREVAAWLKRAEDCASLTCEYLAEEAALAADENGPALLQGLTALASACSKPGQLGTIAGALAALLPQAPMTADDVQQLNQTTTTAIEPGRAIFWWRGLRRTFADQPPCGALQAERCPACRERRGCPAQLLHQQVAYVACLGERGVLTTERIRKELLSTRPDVRVRSWRTHTPDVAAWSAWLCLQFLTEHTGSSPLPGMQVVVELDLHKLEPRLALLLCEAGFLEQNELGDSEQLAVDVLNRRTTDPAFVELATWLAWHQQTLQRQKPKPAKVITHPRLARPAGRANPNPYLP